MSKKKKPGVAAMKRRLAKRKLNNNIGTAAADALREMRDTGEGPSRADIGKDLRDIANRIEFADDHVIVCTAALRHQSADYDSEVAAVLRRTVGGLLYKQRRRLQLLAHRIDGLPPSPDEDLGPEEFEGLKEVTP